MSLIEYCITKLISFYHIFHPLPPYPTCNIQNSYISDKAKLSGFVTLTSCHIDDYSYIAQNSILQNTTIGKCSSIGPNLLCGWGIHPTNGLSTHPMFYSTKKQNGITLSDTDKIAETKPIIIGNDVFIGANVTILDGVTIGDGAIIGACALVNKDVPPYAIVGGVPAKIIRYRFSEKQIQSLLRIKWWNFDLVKIRDVEKLFFAIDDFIKKYDGIETENESV